MNWIFRRAPWLLTALVLLLLLPGTATLPLIDRDEPRFATATREMMDRSDWIVPTFNGHERFDKPVLTYWLMRAGYTVFGVDEFGARVHAIAATLVLVLVTWWIGRRWFGEAVGLFAGAMLASCLQVFIHGRLSLADMPMVACVVVACVAVKELLDTPDARAWRTPAWWFLYLALGIGFLAKGPIVFAVPVLGLLVFRFVLWRHPVAWSRLSPVSGLLLSLLIVASWGIPALVATEGRFWKVGMGEHVVQRGLDRFNGRGYSPFFYAVTSPISLFPWIALIGFLPWIVRRTWGERTAWLVSWIAAPYMIFTAYATQLPHYVLPAFPALALLIGQAIGTDRARWPRGAVRIAWGFFAAVGVILIAVLATVLFAAIPAEAEALRGAFLGVAAVLLGFLLGLAASLTRRLSLVAVGLAAIVCGAFAMGHSLRQTSITANSAEWVSGLPASTRFMGAGFSEPSLVFYTGRRWDFAQDAAELAEAVRRPGPLAVVTVLQETDPLDFFSAGFRQRFGKTGTPRVRSGPTEFAGAFSSMVSSDGWHSREVVGFNLGRTRWQHLQIWTRH